jgi:hypothetical protein
MQSFRGQSLIIHHVKISEVRKGEHLEPMPSWVPVSARETKTYRACLVAVHGRTPMRACGLLVDCLGWTLDCWFQVFVSLLSVGSELHRCILEFHLLCKTSSLAKPSSWTCIELGLHSFRSVDPSRPLYAVYYFIFCLCILCNKLLWNHLYKSKKYEILFWFLYHWHWQGANLRLIII